MLTYAVWDVGATCISCNPRYVALGVRAGNAGLVARPASRLDLHFERLDPQNSVRESDWTSISKGGLVDWTSVSKRRSSRSHGNGGLVARTPDILEV